ncbi:hypothetical protein [Streptomyces sp. NPDC023588]|uniref:hypothetical protein n=1 Tax=Streptomyces sp. NPDC023588 TaxID=3154907 RepID=UPI0033EC695D
MEENGEHAENGSTVRSRRQSPAFAALAGALIGALAGLLGSVLAYAGVLRSTDATEHARQTDIRRAAYVALGLSASAFTDELSDEASFVVSKKIPEAELEKRYNDKFQEVQLKILQAEITAHLVATKSSRAKLLSVTPLRERLAGVLNQAYIKGFSKTDSDKFAPDFLAAREKYTQAMRDFLESVDSEVL